jgi:uncharacterized protein YpmB
MKRITKIMLIVISAVVLIGLLAFLVSLTAYTNYKNNIEQSSFWPEEVDWKTTIEILNTGQVTEVVQSHNLDVTLTLEDDSQIKTIEPLLDDIFRQIELCGSVCREILLITE